MFDSIFIFLVLTSFTWYFFAFPLSRNRPVCLKRGQLATYTFVTFLFLGSIFKFELNILAILLGVIVYVLDLWLVYGVLNKNIIEAILKTSKITRLSIEPSGNSFTANGISLRVFKLNVNTNIIVFSIKSRSRKTKLFRTVFGKLINNNHVKM